MQMEIYVFILMPLYTMAEGCDHAIVRAHIMAIPCEIKFLWSQAFKCSVNTSATRLFDCYALVTIPFMWAFVYEKVTIDLGW